MDAAVMGISPDSVSSHQKFKKKHALSYPLLVDEDHRLADQYGIWKQKSLYGAKYWGVERTTVIIGRDGRIARIFPKVKIPGHVREVEEAVNGL